MFILCSYIIATCQVNKLLRSNLNSVVCSYLSPTPFGVGVGTSLIWAVDQTVPPCESLASLKLAGGGVWVHPSGLQCMAGALGGSFVCLLAQTGVENVPFTL